MYNNRVFRRIYIIFLFLSLSTVEEPAPASPPPPPPLLLPVVLHFNFVGGRQGRNRVNLRGGRRYICYGKYKIIIHGLWSK